MRNNSDKLSSDFHMHYGMQGLLPSKCKALSSAPTGRHSGPHPLPPHPEACTPTVALGGGAASITKARTNTSGLGRGFLMCKHKDLSSKSQHSCKKLSVAVHVSNRGVVRAEKEAQGETLSQEKEAE